jgi:hypothetical protein
MEAINGCVSLNVTSLGSKVSIFTGKVLSGYYYYAYSIKLSFEKSEAHSLHIQYNPDFEVSLKELRVCVSVVNGKGVCGNRSYRTNQVTPRS